MIDAQKLVEIALQKGADDVSARVVKRDDLQLRFSQNKPDILNRWIMTTTALFLTVDGRTTGIELKRPNMFEDDIEKAVRFAKNLPKNPDYKGLYDKTSIPAVRERTSMDLDDLSELGKIAIESSYSKNIKEISGELYLARHNVTISTNYNTLNESRSYLLTTVRVFNHEGAPGQASTHVADKDGLKRFGPQYVGNKAKELAEKNINVKDGSEGTFDILFDPLCFGSTITELGGALSAFEVDSGTSFLTDKIGESVSSPELTIYDDPERPGGGMRGFDDEGAPTRKTLVIDKGVLRSYLHSSSTAKKYDTETTANSNGGQKMESLLPTFWQMYVEPGKRKMKEILYDIKEGLYIANTWYTRYQDQREGDFSTIPRDGIFYIKDGEIKESWKGIRISDNILRILKNVKEVSSELIPVDWWGDTENSFVPYVLVEGVKVTKAR